MAVSLILLPGTCGAWGPDGHQITVDDLRSGKQDGKWDSAAQLAFVINFMGEIHQPLHAITN